MQKMRNILILAFASLFLASCGGTLLEKSAASDNLLVPQSKKTTSLASKAAPSTPAPPPLPASSEAPPLWKSPFFRLKVKA